MPSALTVLTDVLTLRGTEPIWPRSDQPSGRHGRAVALKPAGRLCRPGGDADKQIRRPGWRSQLPSRPLDYAHNVRGSECDAKLSIRQMA